MDLYWVTCIISDSSGVWRCSVNDGFMTLEKAIAEVEFKREHYPVVVCAFIEKTTHESDHKERQVVWLETYI